MGIFDALNDLFSTPISTPKRLDKNCKNCFWSEYQGLVCKLNDQPRRITSTIEAVLCKGYTTTTPVKDQVVATTISTLPPKISYQSVDYQSRGGDDTQAVAGLGDNFALRKTVTLINIGPMNTLNRINYLCPSGTYQTNIGIKFTVQENGGTEDVVLFIDGPPVFNLLQTIALAREYTNPPVIIRVYLKDLDHSGNMKESTTQGYGKNKTEVVYVA